MNIIKQLINVIKFNESNKNKLDPLKQNIRNEIKTKQTEQIMVKLQYARMSLYC